MLLEDRCPLGTNSRVAAPWTYVPSESVEIRSCVNVAAGVQAGTPRGTHGQFHCERRRTTVCEVMRRLIFSFQAIWAGESLRLSLVCIRNAYSLGKR